MTNMFLSFLEISLPISGMIALLLLLTPVFDKRVAARWKYWIWIVLALRLLIPFGGNGGGSPAGPWPRREITGSSGSAQTVAEPHAGGTVRGRVIVEIPAQMTAPIATSASSPASPEKAKKSISWLDIIACVWASGSAYMMVLPLGSYLFFQRRLHKKGNAVKDENVLCLLQRLKDELQIRGAVSAIEYSGAASPMLTGFSSPAIVLPKAQYSAEELYFILKHELIHLKRGDLYVKLLFAVVRAVHWFNPLIWAMQKEAAVDMELSCDDQVIKASGYAERQAYTEALFSALYKQKAQKITLSTNFYGGKQIMKKRFSNILAKTGKKSGAVVLACAVVLAMSVGTLVGCSVTPGSPAAVSSPSGAENMQAGSVQSRPLLQSPVNPTAFIAGMGCSDPACTDASHHHDCPADCADYEHHHTCALDCTEAGHHHAESHPETGLQNSAAPAFVPGMGCSDPTCTDASHHHDCPADCADYEHHHTCALDCTEAGHHHGGTASNNFGNPGSSGNSGTSGGHHNDSGHHGDRHHG